MSERWKPGNGEHYYYFYYDGDVDSDVWRNDLTDRQLFERGNCFKTEKEAQAAAEKVKALLLSLHCDETLQDKQLPKLTAEVFNRPDCPAWAKYAAVDGNGAGYYYSEKPFILSDAFGWGIVCSETNQSELISGKFNNSDWKNSLIERAAKLPDWCKVDAVGWHKRCGYFKVTYIDDISKRVDIQQVEDKSKGYLSFHTVCNEVLQANRRPFNTKEMKSLVGRTVAPDYGAVFLVIKFVDTSEGGEVGIDGIYYNADRLLDKFTINGKPAGVFEHLENGEWVE